MQIQKVNDLYHFIAVNQIIIINIYNTDLGKILLSNFYVSLRKINQVFNKQ